MARRVRTGLEALLERPARLKGLRVGLVANPASITSDLVHASVALARLRGVKLVALFGPEHGIAADAQDLVEVDHSRDGASGLPVHSLYGETRAPTAEMLAGLDAVVVDLQDVAVVVEDHQASLEHVPADDAVHRATDHLLQVIERHQGRGDPFEPQLAELKLEPADERHLRSAGGADDRPAARRLQPEPVGSGLVDSYPARAAVERERKRCALHRDFDEGVVAGDLEGDPVNDFLSGGIRPLDLEEEQIDDLVAFMEALTSPEFEQPAEEAGGE